MSRIDFERQMLDSGVKTLENKTYRDYRRWRGCAGKVQFRDNESAQKAIVRMRTENLETYDCTICGAIHIGHMRGTNND